MSAAKKKSTPRTSTSRTRRSAPEPSGWDRLSERTQHVVCVLALLLIGVGFYAPTVIGGKTLIGSDTVHTRGGMQSMLEYEARTGDAALWLPNMFGGMPGYFVRYKKEVPQLDDLVSAVRELGVWPAATFFVLLMGAYVLVWYLTREKLAAVAAAAAYGLTTYLPVIVVAGHNTKFSALAWAPWALFGLAFTLQKARHPGPLGKTGVLRIVLGGLVFAVTLALEARAMHAQITYYLAFVMALWWLAEGVAAVREGRVRSFVIGTAALAGGGLLALGMIAQPYLAQWELKAFTTRSTGASGGLAWDYAMNWSQGWAELLTLLVPDAFGGSGQTYWGPKPFTAGPHYVGAVVVALAALAVWRVRRPAVWGLAGASVLLTAFALGGSFALLNRPMFDYFPMFSSFRAPETWLAVVALTLAVLAGIGLAALVRPEPTEAEEQAKTRAAYGVFGGLLAAVALLLLVGGSALSFEREGEAARYREAIAAQAAQQGLSASDPRVLQAADGALREVREAREDAFSSDALRTLLFLALAAALVVLYRRGVLPPWAVAAGLALLITVDLWGVGRRYFSDETPALRAEASVDRAIPTYGYDQFILDRVREAGGPGHFRVLPLHMAPSQTSHEAYHYESVGGYHGAKLALAQDYLDRILTDGQGRVNPNGLDLLGARYVTARQPLAGLRPVFQDPQTGVIVLENPDALPRAFLVDDWTVVEDPEAGLALLTDPAFDLRKTAVLYEAPSGLRPAATSEPVQPDSVVVADSARVAPAAEGEPAVGELSPGVRLERFTPRDLVWRVTAERPQLLVVNEVYYPAGWRATVNDEPVEILRANHLLRAVPVPAGEHLVAMEFRPRSHRLGVLIAGVSTLVAYLGVIALTGLLWYRRGHPAP